MLLRLPAKIRNAIYRDVLLPGVVDTSKKCLTKRTALLRTCKQVRLEAADIFFAEATFHATAIDANCNEVSQWLQCWSKQRIQMIPRFTIDIDVSDAIVTNWKRALAFNHPAAQQIQWRYMEDNTKACRKNTIDSIWMLLRSGVPLSSISTAQTRLSTRSHKRTWLRSETHECSDKVLQVYLRLFRRSHSLCNEFVIEPRHDDNSNSRQGGVCQGFLEEFSRQQRQESFEFFIGGMET